MRSTSLLRLLSLEDPTGDDDLDLASWSSRSEMTEFFNSSMSILETVGSAAASCVWSATSIGESLWIQAVKSSTLASASSLSHVCL